MGKNLIDTPELLNYIDQRLSSPKFAPVPRLELHLQFTFLQGFETILDSNPTPKDLDEGGVYSSAAESLCNDENSKVIGTTSILLRPMSTYGLTLNFLNSPIEMVNQKGAKRNHSFLIKTFP